METGIENEYLSIMSQTFLFNGIEDSDIKQILHSCSLSPNSYKSGDLICSPSDFVRGLYIILSGKAVVTSMPEENSTIIRILGVGDIFGAAALFCPEISEYVSYIRAKGNILILLFRQCDVEKMITENSKIAENYIRFLSGRVRFLNKKLSIVTAGTAEQRLASVLFEMPKDEDGKLILPNMTQLASSLNLGRSSLYRAFLSLENSGLIKKTDAGRIIISDTVPLNVLF